MERNDNVESRSIGAETEETQTEQEHDSNTAAPMVAEDDLEFTGFQSGGRAKRVRFQKRKSTGRRARPNEQVRAERRTAIETLRFLHRTCFACGLNSRWILWSNTFFMAGNIMYILLAIFDLETLNSDLLDAGDTDPTHGFALMINGTLHETLRNFAENKTVYNAVNVTGAILFILNPLSDFMGAWAETKVREINELLDKNHYEAENVEEDTGIDAEETETDLHVSLCSLDVEEIDWEQHVATVFCFGSVLYLWQAFEDMKDTPPWYYIGLDKFASLVMLFDSVLGLISWLVSKRMDKGTSRERSLFTLLPSGADWSGWGDWLFFFGSVLDTSVSYMADYPLKTQRMLALTSSLLWFIDAILYIVGYVFGQDVRKQVGSEVYSSLRHIESGRLDSMDSLDQPMIELAERNEEESQVVMI